MQSRLENISVAFTTCVEQQIRPRYIILDAVGGRLHNTACMARCGLRDAFVWLSKPQTIEDHVLYHATIEVGEQGNVPTRRSDRKTIFSDNDHKLYFMGQENTLSDHFFSEEALSEEQLIRKTGQNGGRGLSEKK